MTEKIKCAATRHGDHIVAGKHHGECLRIARDAGFEKPDALVGQGFLTTRMRWVLRKEALEIAKREDQIKHKHRPYDILLSEDLRDKQTKPKPEPRPPVIAGPGQREFGGRG